MDIAGRNYTDPYQYADTPSTEPYGETPGLTESPLQMSVYDPPFTQDGSDGEPQDAIALNSPAGQPTTASYGSSQPDGSARVYQFDPPKRDTTSGEKLVYGGSVLAGTSAGTVAILVPFVPALDLGRQVHLSIADTYGPTQAPLEEQARRASFKQPPDSHQEEQQAVAMAQRFRQVARDPLGTSLAGVAAIPGLLFTGKSEVRYTPPSNGAASGPTFLTDAGHSAAAGLLGRIGGLSPSASSQPSSSLEATERKVGTYIEMQRMPTIQDVVLNPTKPPPAK